ncbi:ornithine cyclodeaminase [Thecamonas trahens ATCC 50062]|uniref:Ornithine cyclodeaminase n=1 Tax=Thecamonas trahens ATCC 50062 TaxID=461836 RepID=A0A0L0DSL2_THETB|nr:ornithine cyclodeaminase [Thecamonas trahens ATCC 50062]KNC55197.1 ornithine cyclodeaminase [Thecamonas trahens ATCC 50062]|eukprot:XP_013753247.1 ornithine cyclodeaminase [Thecamonas trahens ATCC 50062]
MPAQEADQDAHDSDDATATASSPPPDNTLLLMPAWGSSGGISGVKIVTVVPGNSARQLPAVMASYIVIDGMTGAHVALLDGAVLTARRTAAVGALGASLLARPDSTKLLIVGAGAVASQLPYAYAAAMPSINHVTVYNRSQEKAQLLVDQLIADGFDAVVATELETAVRSADIISCATLAREPIILGEWLAPGQHLDLIGSFTPHMREADDVAVSKAEVYVDVSEALAESGDIASPITAGVLAPDDVRGTLASLCSADQRPPREPSHITLFKSVGSAISDLACAGVAVPAPEP